ncbi:MAG: hypothetical protein BWY78_01426 [Alphaproteobacteria bacterium ADurb.Bin438]|nr:MAG: hypothetical protein BWY78_01426 [Alphaproteobacteria bacterium ADurb.Bin438]
MFAKPIPNAIIKGTVIGPVVTPPASKATDKKLSGTNKAKIKVKPYKIASNIESLILRKILKTESNKNKPTPKATDKIIIMFGTFGTCSANTCKSGSDIVTTVPIKKLINKIDQSFLDFVKAAPINSPIGIIAISAPIINIPIPKISNNEPTIKTISMSILIGTSKKDNKKTIILTGIIDVKDSIIFSFKFK